MNEENFAELIRQAGSEVAAAEQQLGLAEAREKQTASQLMVVASAAHNCKTVAAQTTWADGTDEMFQVRLDKGRAKGALAAAKANLLAAEVQFKKWQTERASERMERRVYNT